MIFDKDPRKLSLHLAHGKIMTIIKWHLSLIYWKYGIHGIVHCHDSGCLSLIWRPYRDYSWFSGSKMTVSYANTSYDVGITRHPATTCGSRKETEEVGTT